MFTQEREPKFTLTLTHNTPDQDTTVVKRNVPKSELIDTIRTEMPNFRSIEVMAQATGEIVYSRYADLDFFEDCGELDNPLD
jgi:hypothetical protein